MFGLAGLGKILIIAGVIIIGVGFLLMIGDKVPWLGKLPGDILIRRERFTFFFPIVTCILISLILTFLFWIFRR